MGTAAGVTNFCGLHANVHGDIRQVVHGVADDLLERIARLGGLNEPHALFGKTVAQAYDTAAYKIAADDLLLSAGVEILFHALGAGVVMDDDAGAGPAGGNQVGPPRRDRPRLHRRLRRRRPRRLGRRALRRWATATATCSTPRPCSA
jgi:hypothetical protein